MITAESQGLDDAIRLFWAGIDLGTAFTARFGNLGDFIASYFYEIPQNILDDLDIETAQLLLLSPSLQIEDEDSLYDFVRSRSEKDLRFASLFEFVYFEYLSVDQMKDFAVFVNKNLSGGITSGIWEQICGRLILKAKPKDEPHHHNYCRSVLTDFVYDESKPLDGVIAHLTRKRDGNVHDRRIVLVTASSLGGGHQKNAVDLW